MYVVLCIIIQRVFSYMHSPTYSLCFAYTPTYCLVVVCQTTTVFFLYIIHLCFFFLLLYQPASCIFCCTSTKCSFFVVHQHATCRRACAQSSCFFVFLFLHQPVTCRFVCASTLSLSFFRCVPPNSISLLSCISTQIVVVVVHQYSVCIVVCAPSRNLLNMLCINPHFVLFVCVVTQPFLCTSMQFVLLCVHQLTSRLLCVCIRPYIVFLFVPPPVYCMWCEHQLVTYPCVVYQYTACRFCCAPGHNLICCLCISQLFFIVCASSHRMFVFCAFVRILSVCVCINPQLFFFFIPQLVFLFMYQPNVCPFVCTPIRSLSFVVSARRVYDYVAPHRSLYCACVSVSCSFVMRIIPQIVFLLCVHTVLLFVAHPSTPWHFVCVSSRSLSCYVCVNPQLSLFFCESASCSFFCASSRSFPFFCCVSARSLYFCCASARKLCVFFCVCINMLFFAFAYQHAACRCCVH